MTETRKFGLLFAGICALVAAYSFFRGGIIWPYFLAGGAFFLFSGLFFEALLRPIQRGWMKFAYALGWMNTRILLGIFFYLILTPGSLLRRLFGKDPLQRGFDRSADTYWVKRDAEPLEKSRYERLF